MSDKLPFWSITGFTILLLVLGLLLIRRNYVLLESLNRHIDKPAAFPSLVGYCVSNRAYIPCVRARARVIAFLLTAPTIDKDVQYWNTIAPALEKAGFDTIGICDSRACADKSLLQPKLYFTVFSYGQIVPLNMLDRIFRSDRSHIVITDQQNKIIRTVRRPMVASDILYDPLVRVKE
jgi:hypothetical protein